MKRKAQAAMEFLLTYGWAILVVLVVLGALAYFGVLKPQNLLPDRCGAPSGIVCQDYQIQKTPGQVTVVLQNGMGRTMYVQSINATTPEGVTCTGTPTPGNDVIANGATGTLTATCGDTTAMANPGAKQKAEYSVRYSYDVAGTITHLLSGDIFTSVS